MWTTERGWNAGVHTWRRGGVREDLATREPVTCKHSDFLKKSSLSLHSELTLTESWLHVCFLDKRELCTRKVTVKVAQSCPALCDSMDYIVHGILQARMLEWVAFPFSRESSQTQESNPGLRGKPVNCTSCP